MSALHEPRIRPATSEDIEALATLQASAPEAAQWSEDALRNAGAHSTQILVCDLGEEWPVGFVIFRLAADEMEILNLVVQSKHRRRGIGQLLLDFALCEAAAKNAQRAFLEVRESNLAAQAFYRRQGFAVVGQRRAYYENLAEDALVMNRQISGSATKTP
jgi:ribosomal-protein-alanine N-acetyltransferase